MEGSKAGNSSGGKKKRGGKFRRAQLRNMLLTKTVDRLMRGRLRDRHLKQPIELREVELAVPNWPRAFECLYPVT